jgi:hypothetical protein
MVRKQKIVNLRRSLRLFQKRHAKRGKAVVDG